MGIGIGITVDVRQVKEACREIDFLNKGLKQVEDADLAPDKDGLQATSELIRKISEDIRRMKGLVVKGEQQGSLLKKEQFQEAATLSKRIGQNMGEYTKEITKARAELTKLLEEKAKLGRTSSANPHEWVVAQERIERLNDREKGLRSNYDRLKRNDPKAQDLARRGSEYADAIGSYGDAPGEEGVGTAGAAMAIGYLRRAAGYGTMLLGGGSLLSVARNSWGEYHKLADKESGLMLRGVRFNRELSPWGYLQVESADTAMSLRRATGAFDGETLSRIQRFSRLNAMDPAATVGLIGGYYNVTAADPQKQRQAIDALLYMGKQAKDGRSEQLLGLINQNLMIASRAQGGRELTSSQTSTVMAQTAALYNAPGTMGFTSNLYQTMQNALMPGGSPASEILKWDIAGGFQNGPLTSERMIELQQRRNAGLNDPTNLRRAIAGARRYSKSRSGQIMYMQMVLDSFGEQGGVDKAAAIIDNADRLMSARLPGDREIAGGIAAYSGMYRESPAFDIGQRYGKDDFVSIMTGESLDPQAEKLQDLKWKGKSLLGGGGYLKPSRYDALIQTKSQKYGIHPLWLKSVVQQESSYNRFAISPKGAKGLGQFMPKTGRQYGLKTDADFYDPEKSIDASAHYLRDLQRQFKGDIGRATMAYNAGPDAVMKGRLPEETKAYHAMVMRNFDSAAKSLDWRDMAPATQRTEGVGLLTRIATTLDDISRKIGYTNFAPGASGSVRAPMPVGR